MASSDPVTRWLELIQQAYMLAKGERTNAIEGRYVPRFDSRGLHPYSELWGRIWEIEWEHPWLGEIRTWGDTPCNPITMKKLAEQDAYDDFKAMVRAA